MKKKVLFIALLATAQAYNSSAQNVFPTTGNVGIGTSSPSTDFTLFGDALIYHGSATETFHIEGGQGENIVDIATFIDAQIYLEDVTGSLTFSPDLINYNSGIDRYEFSSDVYHIGTSTFVGQSTFNGNAIFQNNVGIGTASPSTDFTLFGDALIFHGSATETFHIEGGQGENIIDLATYTDAQLYLENYYNSLTFSPNLINYNSGSDLYTFESNVAHNGTTTFNGTSTFNGNVISDVNIVDNSLIVKNSSGTTNFKVNSAGEAYARYLKVTYEDLGDYVFAPDYQRMSLYDLEKYVHSNRHLPGIPSCDEVAEEGMDVGEMTNNLLVKVEELTLYIIELQKQIDALKNEQSLEK